MALLLPSPSGGDRTAAQIVATLTEVHRSAAAVAAREVRTLAAAADLIERQRAALRTAAERAADIPGRSMIAELATATRTSERTVQRRLWDAWDLCERFPALVTALESGRVTRGHVAVIHEAGAAIDDAECRARFTHQAIERADELTPGRLRPVAQLLAARAQPRTLDERHAEARLRRAVRIVDGSDGMADLIATLPAVLARGIHDRLTQLAHAAIDARGQTPDAPCAADASAAPDGSAAEAGGDLAADGRCLDEVRADAFCALLLTARADSCATGDALEGIRATVQVTVPVLTAAGRGDEPAVLAGYGPIDPDTARRLLGGASAWERVLTCPTTGVVLAVDRYRPSTPLRRYLRVRDERCRFPGCRQPAPRCDIDHTVDAACGGATEPANLAHLCRRHHSLKHASPWRVRQLAGGVLEWTSPTGRICTDRPEPAVRFAPADDPPPF